MTRLALAGSALAAVLSTGAGAVTYTWTGGNYVSGTTSPNPLLSPDILSIVGGGNKIFGTAFTNQSGTVSWSDGTIFLGGGALVGNRSLWQSLADTTLTITSGGGTFDNSGTFAKTGGTGNTTFGSLAFVNSGTLDAQTGTILLSNSANTFNAGTAFTGAGIVSLASNATFNGAFTSENLDFTGGTYTGNTAALDGTADFVAGGFTGDWTVAAGSTLTVLGGANKIFGAGTFDNDGTVAWSDGTLFLGGGGMVVNDGTWNASIDQSFTITSGGGTFTNNGTFAKTGGTGNTAFSSLNFVNNGTLDAQTGTILLGNSANTFNAGTAFTGAGIVSLASNATFNGAFTSANLDFTSGTYTGNAASLGGSADFVAGTFTGSWNVAAGSSLTILGGANKVFGAGTFDNDGTVAWSDGTLFLGGGGAVVNDGAWNASTDQSFTVTSGGGTFTNNGSFTKTGGTGATSLAGIGLDNEGTMDVRSGTIALPGNFSNDGTLAGTGTFQVSGTLTNAGVMAPGDGGIGIGTLTVNGGFAQTALGTLSIQLSSISAYDWLSITGTAALNGTLALSCAGCTLNAGELYTILDSAGDLSGMFVNVTATGFNPGFGYSVLYDTMMDRVQLRIDAAGMPVAPPAAVPEPAAWMTMILGFALVGGAARRRTGGRRVVTA